MYLGRSWIPYPTTAKVDVIRRTTQRVGGRILDNGEVVYLHRDVPARIEEVRLDDKNQGKPSGAGMVSAKEYHVGLGGFSIPNKMVIGDFVRVYWGTKPNLYANVNIPQGYGPQLILKVGTDLITLTWNNENGWVSDSYSLLYDESWELFLDDTVIATFSDNVDYPNISCSDFPEGIVLLRISGPPQDYEILRINHQEDDRGSWHHTSLIVELSDTDKGTRK